jgi:hypothetical protein
MSIKLGCNLDFSDFKIINVFESNFNNDKVILSNNLELESDFTNNGIILIRGSIIFNGGKLINKGDIYLIESNILEFTISDDIIGDNVFTGISINQNINNLSLFVLGPIDSSINWFNQFDFQLGKEKPFYFSNDGGLTAKNKIEPGDKLYWNESYSKLRIYKTWRIILKYF